MSQIKKINTAVIGVGNMGRNHARNYFQLKESHLAAVSDSRVDLGQEIAVKYGCAFYQDYKKMLEDPSIEAVSVAVPTEFHHQVVLDTIHAGKHVLVEKPIAATLEQGCEMIDAAQNKGVIFSVGHIERFNPAVRKLKEMIDGGEMGDIISIVSRRVGPSAPQIKDTGVLIDLAVHDIDIICHLAKEKPAKLCVKGGRALGKGKEDHAEIFLKFSKLSGYIQVNWITPVMIRDLNVTGTKGYANLNYITQELDLYRSEYEEEYNNFGDFIIKFGTPRKMSVPIERCEPLALELKAFLGSVRKNIAPEVTGSDGLTALAVAINALKEMEPFGNGSSK